MARRRPTGKRSVDAAGTVRVHGKAGNGEGSVYFTGDGRWRATYHVAGESRPRSVSAATREKAVAKRTELLEELARMPVHPTAMSRSTTIGDLAEWWLENVHRHQVRASTWTKAEDRVRRIVATLGAIQVRKLHVEQIVTWQSDL